MTPAYVHPSEMVFEPTAELTPRRLGHVLIALAHPNIEELASASAVRVETKPTEGTPLNRTLLTGDARRNAFASIARALAHAHAHGWAHGSLTPRKVMVSTSGGAVLTGFECAVAVNGPSDEAARCDIVALGRAFLNGSDVTSTAHHLRAKLAEQPTDGIDVLAQDCAAGRMTADQVILRLKHDRLPAWVAMPRRPAGRTIVVVAASIALVGLVAVLVGGIAPSPVGDRKVASVAAVAPPFRASEALRVTHGDSTFEVDARAGDKLLAAGFDCGNERAVLLRSSDRTLWLFAELPERGRETSATPLQPSARVVDAWVEQSNGCARLGAMYPDGNVGRIQVTK